MAASSLLSALGELLVEEVAELGWSLTSMPLSCWSPLSSLPSTSAGSTAGCCECCAATGREEVAACCSWEPTAPAELKLMGFTQAFTAGTGAGVVASDTIIAAAMLFLLVTTTVLLMLTFDSEETEECTTPVLYA